MRSRETYLSVVPILYHSQLEGLASFVLCIRMTGHYASTIRSLVELDLSLSAYNILHRGRKRVAKELVQSH